MILILERVKGHVGITLGPRVFDSWPEWPFNGGRSCTPPICSSSGRLRRARAIGPDAFRWSWSLALQGQRRGVPPAGSRSYPPPAQTLSTRGGRSVSADTSPSRVLRGPVRRGPTRSTSFADLLPVSSRQSRTKGPQGREEARALGNPPSPPLIRERGTGVLPVRKPRSTTLTGGPPG